MHLILFPVVYGVFSFFVMTIGVGISFIGRKSPMPFLVIGTIAGVIAGLSIGFWFGISLGFVG